MKSLILFSLIVAFGPYSAQVVRVIDGDTIVMDIAVWPGQTQRVSLRLAGIDTPELRGRECEKTDGRRARAFVAAWLVGKTVTVTDIRRGKYAGRVIGRITAEGDDLSSMLLAAGLAQKYEGGKRKQWVCVGRGSHG